MEEIITNEHIIELLNKATDKIKGYKQVIRQAITIITTLRLEKNDLEAKVKRLEYENLTLKSELAEAKVKARAKSWFIL